MVTELGSWVMVLLSMDRPATSYAELQEANGNGERNRKQGKETLKQRNDPYALLMHDSICGNERGWEEGKRENNSKEVQQ